MRVRIPPRSDGFEGAESTVSGLACGDLETARSHALAGLAAAETTRAQKSIAWSHKLLADIAVLEDRIDDAATELGKAEAVLARYPCPVIECQIIRAGAALARKTRDSSAVGEYRARARAVIRSLADSLNDDTPRSTFLRSKAVRDL